MARPPVYERTFSFSDWETNNPGQPKPGASLDTEYDDVSNAVLGTQAALALIQRDDGRLANASVGVDQLEPGLFDGIADPILADCTAQADRAQSYANLTVSYAGTAQTAATQAALAATNAQGAAATSSASASAAAYADANATAAAGTAQAAADLAVSTVGANDGAVAESEANVELSYRWAEYLAGPVAPVPPVGPGGTPYPEAVDDGMWSSKWWALRARDIVGAFGSMYLGPHGTAPMTGNAGEPLAPGMLYFDTTLSTMMVWDGNAWVSFGQPTPAISKTMVYQATAGQTVFTGTDLFGTNLDYNDIYPEGTDVHVNGVRLVDRRGGAVGDYNVDVVGNTITIFDPNGLTANSIVQVDQLTPVERLNPTLARVDLVKLQNFSSLFDGIEDTFELRNASTGALILPSQALALMISLDGLPQEADVDYSIVASTVIFAQPPPVSTRFWGLWFKPWEAP